jgi:putative tryptophan/tyrosine transport system substrate-binding protein
MPHRWSRRQVVQGAGAVGLALLAGCGRWPGQAPAPATVHRIGFLSSATPAAMTARLAAFRQGLHELGYVEGTNLLIETRWAEGQLDRVPELAAELAHLSVDVLVVHGDEPIRSAKQASSMIPIVMGLSGDPVGLGFVASLARPGGHITGLSIMSPQLSAKRLELLKEAVPSTSRVGFVWYPGNPGIALALRETETAAPLLRVQVQPLEVRSPNDFGGAFDAAIAQGVDALRVTSGGLTTSHLTRIIELAAERRLPTLYEGRESVLAGGLMSYGPNIPELSRRAATYVDKILKGANPADLPIEQPMRFDFVINLRTAQALGLTIPHHVLLQATEVIQ